MYAKVIIKMLPQGTLVGICPSGYCIVYSKGTLLVACALFCLLLPQIMFLLVAFGHLSFTLPFWCRDSLCISHGAMTLLSNVKKMWWRREEGGDQLWFGVLIIHAIVPVPGGGGGGIFSGDKDDYTCSGYDLGWFRDHNFFCFWQSQVGGGGGGGGVSLNLRHNSKLFSIFF